MEIGKVYYPNIKPVTSGPFLIRRSDSNPVEQCNPCLPCKILHSPDKPLNLDIISRKKFVINQNPFSQKQSNSIAQPSFVTMRTLNHFLFWYIYLQLKAFLIVVKTLCTIMYKQCTLNQNPP